MKSYAIYTVITGGYEEILQPLLIDDRFDYILFTDIVRSQKIGVWTVRPIPFIKKIDNIRLSRYPKSHPASMLSEYEASLYIDANIQIKDDWIYSRFIELVYNKVEYAGVKLVVTGRDCIYDHAFDMCRMNVEYDHIGIKHCHELFLRGFPPHYGLNENNMIFRLHTDTVKQVDEEWWYWITHFSLRDQFSYMYCLWKFNIPIHYILPMGEDTRNSSHFNFIVHNNNPIVAKRKYKKKGLFEKIRLYALSVNVEDGLQIWTKSYKAKRPYATYCFLSLIAVCKRFPSLMGFAIKKLVMLVAFVDVI